MGGLSVTVLMLVERKIGSKPQKLKSIFTSFVEVNLVVRAFTSGLLNGICWYNLASKHKNHNYPDFQFKKKKKNYILATVPSYIYDDTVAPFYNF